VIAALALWLSTHPGFTWVDGSYAGLVGYTVQVDPPPGGDGAPVFYEAANPGDPLVVEVTVTNPGPLPIRIEGIVEDPVAPERIITRWTAMTTARDPWNVLPIDQLQAFAPVVIDPGQQLAFYLVAKAGECTYGRDFAIDAPNIGGYVTRSREIRFAYSVFGLSSSAPFELPMSLAEPTRNDCPAAGS
jgi:hypothetical protein